MVSLYSQQRQQTVCGILLLLVDYYLRSVMSVRRKLPYLLLGINPPRFDLQREQCLHARDKLWWRSSGRLLVSREPNNWARGSAIEGGSIPQFRDVDGQRDHAAQANFKFSPPALLRGHTGSLPSKLRNQIASA